jgi:UDP-N-acetylmuramate dehydrogenase
MRPVAVREQVALSAHTSFQVGGPARFWLELEDPNAVAGALEWADARRVPLVVLGGGSNVLVADRGLEALVLRLGVRGLLVRERDGRTLVRAGAGLGWDELVGWSVEHGLGGIECLSGIPGDVGAVPVQNVGAYGQEVASCIESVQVVERATGRRLVLSRAECDFAYRHSTFKAAARDRYVIVAVELGLQRGASPRVPYPELERALERARLDSSPAAVRRTVLELRRSKSMLIDPADENHRSAGSFFVNPTLEPAEAELVRDKVRSLLGPSATMPEYPAPGGRVKLGAGWLVEHAGVAKGTVLGRAAVSTRHCLALVNRGDASAMDIVELGKLVRARVRERFGVSLTPEPELLGFEPGELAGLRD